MQQNLWEIELFLDILLLRGIDLSTIETRAPDLKSMGELVELWKEMNIPKKPKFEKPRYESRQISKNTKREIFRGEAAEQAIKQYQEKGFKF